MPAIGTAAGKRVKAPAKKKAKVRAPSQTKIARAAEQAYASQGRSVERQAGKQKRAATRKIARTQEQTYKSQGQSVTRQAKKQTAYRDAQTPPKHKTTIVRVKNIGPASEYTKRNDASVTGKLAPVLKVLDQTTRPIHALAAAEVQDVKTIKQKGLKHYLIHGGGKPARQAALKGIKNQDKSTTSDVLTEAGWNPKGTLGKIAKGAVAFTGDVAQDPTTITTGGAGSVAEHAGAAALKRVEKKALVKGLTAEQAKRMGERASTQAAKKAADKGSGVTLRLAGQEVPGVRRATAKAGRSGGKAFKRVVPEKARNASRSAAGDVNPNIAPVGVPKAAHQAEVTATRTARAKTTQGERHAVNIAHGIKTQIGKDNYNTVIDAIEAQKIGSLPAELRPHAVALRSELRHVRKVQRRAGIKVPERKGYVPRQLTPEAIAAKDAKAARPGKASMKPKSSKARVETRPMSQVRVDKPGKYRTDLHALVAERVAEGHSSAALAELNQRLGDLGTTVKRGTLPAVQKTEAVFHIKAGQAPRQVTDKAEIARIAAPLRLNKAGTKIKNATPKSVGAGRYVVLNRDVVKRAVEGANPKMGLADKGIIRGIDKTTGVFKRLALGTPGFHVRNFIGDTSQAYIKQPGQNLAGNMVRARRITKELGKQEKAGRVLGQPKPSGKTMHLPKYGHTSYEDIAKNLVAVGAARSGYTARELRELGKSGSEGTLKVTRPKAPAGAKRLLLNREDIPRLATAINALRNGATWEEAASRVADTHFDYGHLTSFERNVARRLMPFYTWSARNIPFQAKAVITNPGKYAAYQKAREEFAKTTQPGQVDEQTKGMYAQLERAGVKLPGGWEKYLTEYEQRNAGLPVGIGGKKFTISAGLPLTDLNEFPGAALGNQLTEWYQKGMSLTGPIPKDMVEYFDNHSFYFRDQLERDNSPLVAAPSYAAHLPAAIRKWAGVTPNLIDKKTGKKVLGWKGKADYVFSAIPGTPNYIKQFATRGADRRGKGTVGKALAYAGVKNVPIDPARNAVNLAYARQGEIQKRLKALSQQGVNKSNPSAEWRRLNDQLKIVGQVAYGGKAAQGYAVLPKSGGPPKIRSTAGGRLNGAGSSGGGSLNGASAAGGGKLN
jgi:hypothetical protein